MKLDFKKNKWLYAFIATAVVLVAAIVVAIVLGVKLGKANDEPEYVEGAEVGVYYYDVSDGEIALTLSGGNSFTIAGSKVNKTGSYTANGNNLVLDFVRDEDGTANATISGDTVVLVYNDATMTFLKKVNYTVSFNANGGSAVASVSVVNGKNASKPADPTKPGSVFLGWYADDALTTPFDFGAKVIKADTTVHAKWASDDVIGANKSTVDFVLGYDGAPAIEPIKTISGLVYGAPTDLERTGYTFGGWWISMYEDGEKLSYQYTEDTVITADTTLFAVWYDDNSTKLHAPNASVTGSNIKWNAVSNASGYSVVVYDANGTQVASNDNVGSTTFAFDFSAYPAGEYRVEVVAKNADASKNSDAAVRYYANKTLDRVSNFNVVNGVLVYNSVEGAERYYVTVDCGNKSHNHTNFDNGNSTVYNITNCSMQKGGIKITVTASAKGYADSVSETFVYEKNLNAITGITYDAVKDAFVWNSVENAVSYNVEITVGQTTHTFNVGGNTSFSVANYTGDITVKVTPVTAGYNSPDAVTATANKTSPSVPTGVTVTGTIVSWDEVKDATEYVVKINGQSFRVETNSLDIVENAIELVVGNSYSISVQAISTGGASAFSKELVCGYLVMSNDVSYSNNTVSWTPVIGTSNYLVRVNGGETISVNGCSTPVKLTKKGVNTIEVKYT